MNKKGFVLLETLIVTIFVLFIFGILYNSIVPLLGKYQQLSYYDDLDATYDLYHLVNFLKEDGKFGSITNANYQKISCESGVVNNVEYCESLFYNLDIDSEDELLYLNTNYVNELKNDTNINISEDIKNYLQYIDVSGKIFILQNDGYTSYLNILNASDKIKNSINESSCNPSVTDTDGTIYLSGTKDCVNFNYVWYSGKLWRITAIYPDGTMKLITDGNVTAVEYGNNANFYTDENNKSHMYQWLNEDFFDTLVNPESIIVIDYKWNATSGNGVISSKLPSTIAEGATLVSAPIGLLNSYEYYKSYQNTNYSSGYLNSGYLSRLLNRYDTDDLYTWRIHSSGSGRSGSVSLSYPCRPSIVLKNNISFSGGNGTKDAPYEIKGDKEKALENTTLLNTRTSGEYVNFSGDLYRIVEIQVIDGKLTTKLNKIDYIRDSSNQIVKKNFASTTTFGLSTNTKSDEYWDYYLNNTWLKSIDSTYDEVTGTSKMLVKGVYYLGQVINNTSINQKMISGYKSSICATVDNTTKTKTCEKTSNIWTGYVGLQRYAEMFSDQQLSSSNATEMWMITPISSEKIHYVNKSGGGNGNYNILSYKYAIRPSINLNSEVIITGGEGTKEKPFEVSLP